MGAFIGAEPKGDTEAPPVGITDGGVVSPKDGPNDEPCIPVELKEDDVPGGAKGPDEDAGTDNPESSDSREFEAGVVVLTSGRESKFAQSLLLGCWTATVGGGSGTASKSINEVSTFISDGFASDDAKLLEDAVLCKRSICDLYYLII